MAHDMIITLSGKAKVTASYGGMEIATDQPPSAGGDGSAPAPFALFLASIGTCAGIYVMKFCQTRGIPTDGIRLVQKIVPDPERPGRVAALEIDIELPPDFPEKYRDAVIHAAEGCAVKKHIQEPPRFEVRTVVRAG